MKFVRRIMPQSDMTWELTQLRYVAQYNANDPQPSHFTQVVWKATTQVGCAVKDCPGLLGAQYGVRPNILFFLFL